MTFAKATLNGTLVADPEKRFTSSNHAVTTLTLSVENAGGFTKSGNNTPFLIKVTCWRNVAEAAVEHLRKDDEVLVDGKLMMNSYQAQDGLQKKSFELEATSVEKLPGKPQGLLIGYGGTTLSSSGSSSGFSNNGHSQTTSPPLAVAPSGSSSTLLPPDNRFSSEDLLTEDDIPF